MGYHAIQDAFRVGRELALGDRAKIVFLYMALVCRDSNDSEVRPRLYFGGHVSLATALGFDAPENVGEAAQRAVKRAVKELVDKGAITRLSFGRAGRNATYELLVASKPEERQVRATPIRSGSATVTHIGFSGEVGDGSTEDRAIRNAF